MSTLPNMSDNLTILLFMIGIGLFILIPSSYFGGKIGIIVAASVLTGLTSFLFIWAKAMGKSFANSNAPSTIGGEEIMAFMAIAAAYLFIGYGAFCISQLARGIDGYLIKLVVWTVLVLSYPIYSYSTDAYDSYITKTKQYKTKIILAHPNDFPVLFDDITFYNSKKKKKKVTYSTYRFHEDRDIVRNIEGLSDENSSMYAHRYYKRLSATMIPIDFDTFSLSYYSPLENRFYKDYFPLDQKKLRVWQEYEGQMVISDLLINILPGGNVDLLKKEYLETTHTIPYSKVEFVSTEGLNIDSIFKLFTPNESTEPLKEVLTKRYENLNNGTVSKYSPEEILSFRGVYEYSMNFEILAEENEVYDLKKISTTDFYLNTYLRSAKFLSTAHKMPLPSFFRIKLKSNLDKENGDEKWVGLKILLNKMSLLNQFTAFMAEHQEDVSFDIEINTIDIQKSLVYLKSGDEKILLEDFIIEKW